MMCGLPMGNNVGLTTNIVRASVNYRFRRRRFPYAWSTVQDGFR
jgi:hypothetical protein